MYKAVLLNVLTTNVVVVLLYICIVNNNCYWAMIKTQGTDNETMLHSVVLYTR